MRAARHRGPAHLVRNRTLAQYASHVHERDWQLHSRRSYVIRYESGAQLHQPVIRLRITAHYVVPKWLAKLGTIYSGESVDTGATSLWLDDQGLG